MSNVIITAQTTAKNSGVQSLGPGDVATFQVTGTQVAAEYIDIAVSTDGGSTFVDLYQDGAQVRLHSGQTTYTIAGPLIFRFEKNVTTNAVGLIRIG